MKNKTKRQAYLVLWVITGILLGILVGGLIELLLLKMDIILNWYFIFIYGPTVIMGILFGVWSGPVCWRKIYVEGLRGKNYVIKQK